MGTNTHHDKLDEAIRGDYALKTSPSPTIGAGHIAPSVGRVVWYWPAGQAENSAMSWFEDGQPLKADICHVNLDGTVNLSINDHHGEQFTRGSVTLHQGDAQGCSLPRPFATWMPYQKEMVNRNAAS